MWAVATQPRTGLTPTIPTPSVDSGMARADVTSNLLLRAGTRGAGGEALHGGGDARQVELAEVVHHVPPHAGQVSGPGAAEPAKPSVGENGVQPAAVAGCSLSLHQALRVQGAGDGQGRPRPRAQERLLPGAQWGHRGSPACSRHGVHSTCLTKQLPA